MFDFEKVSSVDDAEKNVSQSQESEGLKNPALKQMKNAEAESPVKLGLRDFTDEERNFFNQITSQDRGEYVYWGKNLSPVEEKKKDLLTREHNIERIMDAGIVRLQDLSQALLSLGGVYEDDTYYSAEDLNKTIEDVAKGEVELESLPAVFGLREKVGKLLADEVLQEPFDDSQSSEQDYSGYFAEGVVPVVFKHGIKIRVLPEQKWRRVNRGIPQSINNYSPSEFNHYPKIGGEGLATRFGTINGPLVWCDGSTAIFQTSQGYLMVPFADLIAPSGKTYGEIEIEIKDKNKKEMYESEARMRKTKSRESNTKYMSL